MTDDRLDLSPLDPEHDPDRVDRVIGNTIDQLVARDPGADRGRSAPQWLAWAASLAAAVLLGGAAGWVLRGAVEPAGPGAAPFTGPAEPAIGLASLFDGIDIDDDQRARLRAVIETRQPESDELLVAVARELERIVTSRDAEIRALLDPDQRALYARRVEESPILGFRREYRTERARVVLEAVLDPNR